MRSLGLLGVSLLIIMVKEFSKASAGAVGDTKCGEVTCVGAGAEARLRAIVTVTRIAVLIVACGEEIALVEAGSVGDASVHEGCGAGVAAGGRARAGGRVIVILILITVLIAVLIAACGEEIALVEAGSVGDAGAHDGGSIGVAESGLPFGEAFDLSLS
jgi:hypothetical protein